jgi:YVTN family beta-propeller protein
VLLRHPQGQFSPRALLCTDVSVLSQQIVEWFVLHCKMEVTCEKVRAHLGIETQCQWAAAPIQRITSALLAGVGACTMPCLQERQAIRIHVSQSGADARRRTAAAVVGVLRVYSAILARIGNDRERMMTHRRPRLGLLILLGSLLAAAVISGGISVSFVPSATASAVRLAAAADDPRVVAVDEMVGRVFVLESNGVVLMLDARSGRVLGRVLVAGGYVGPFSDAAVDASRGRAYFAASAGVYLFDTRRGVSLGRVATGSVQAVAVDTRLGQAFVLHTGGSVSVLDGRSGRLLQTVAVGSAPAALAVDGHTAHVFVVSANAPNYGPQPNGTVSVLDSGRRSVVQTIPVGRGPTALAVDDRHGDVFVANYPNGTVSTLDATSGRVQHTTFVGPGPSAIAVDPLSRHVFVLCQGSLQQGGWNALGTISIVDARNAHIVRTVAIGPNVQGMAVDHRTKRLFIISQGARDAHAAPTGPGTISILDMRTGQIVRTLQTGIAPLAVAVDETRARVFVANYGRAYFPAPALTPWEKLARWLQARLPWSSTPSRSTVTHGIPTGRNASGSVLVIDESRL